MNDSNKSLIEEYLSYRLNPDKKLSFPKISESRARRIKFNLEKIEKYIGKSFSIYTAEDIENFFSKLKSGELKKSKRVNVQGDIPLLKQKVPYSKTSYYNIKSDFRNFWKFLVYKYNFEDIFLYIE